MTLATMEQDQKFSRFMFHLKFSSTEDYVHEHELYEVMRSRHLYQSQFGVRSNFKKIMRNIEISEKAQRYSFENSRKLFVQKMRERREQAAKFKSFAASLEAQEEKKPMARRYIPLQESTTVYTTELPVLVPPKTTRPEHVTETITQTPSLPVQTTPSMVTTLAFTPDEMSIKMATSKKHGRRKMRLYHSSSKIMIAGKENPVTQIQEHVSDIDRDMTDNCDTLTESVYDAGAIKEVIDSQINGESVKEDLQNPSSANFAVIETIPENVTEQNNVHINGDDFNQLVQSRELNMQTKSVSKVEDWAEKHCLVKTNPIHDQVEIDLRRMMIDRPSKWAVYSAKNNEETVLAEFGSFASKSLDNVRKKMQRKEKKSRSKVLTLPELDNTPKPMVTMDPGGTTPDGRLILTAADYKEYLGEFNKARVIRLTRTKKQQKSLQKMVDNFRVGSPLRLRDESSMRSSAKTV